MQNANFKTLPLSINRLTIALFYYYLIFTNYIPKFDALGYTNEQVWSLLKTANAKDLQYIIDKKYSYAQMQPFMEVNGFKFTDMEGYMKVYATKQKKLLKVTFGGDTRI